MSFCPRTHRRRAPWCALLALGLALVAFLGCRRPIAPELGLEAVDHPDLSSIEAVARNQVESQKRRLDEAIATSDDADALANAFGALGELYHAYELQDAALGCYRNAAKIDGDSFVWPYYLGVLSAATGNPDGARTQLERALGLRDDDGARYHLANTLLTLGEVEGSRQLFEALQATPGFTAAARHGLGRVALEESDATVAIEHFEAALDAQPEAGVIRHALGLAHRQAGDLETAERLLSEENSGEIVFPDPVLERVAELAISSGAYLKRGNRALVAEDLGRAVDAFEKSIEANPDNSEAHRNLALTLARQNNLDRGLEVLEAAALRFPDNVWIHYDLGTTRMGTGNPEGAVAAFERAVEISPDLVAARFNLANALIGLQRWDDSMAHLQRVLTLEPDHGRARYLMAMGLHQRGESDQAIHRLEKLLEDEPDNRVARQGLVEVLVAQGRLPRALEVFEQGLEREMPLDERVDMLNQMAETAWRAGRREQALAAWRRAVDEAPESSVAHTSLANGLQLVGRRAEARDHFAHAVALDPTNATAWLSEASLWILDGEVRTARDRLEEALRHVPDHVGLIHTLARLLATSADIRVRDGARALELARRAYNLERNLDHAETLAMALAENEQYEEAIQWQRRLITQMGPSTSQGALQRLVANLRRYENRQPVRVQ